jgi:hypothetical protein
MIRSLLHGSGLIEEAYKCSCYTGHVAELGRDSKRDVHHRVLYLLVSQKNKYHIEWYL